MNFVNGHWVNQLDPKLIHLWGEIGVSYYGLAYVLGFVFGIYMHRMFQRAGRSPFNAAQEELALYAMVLGVLVGARVGFILLYALPDTLQRPWFIFEVWKGGMSSHGGFIGVVLACWYVSRRVGIRLAQFGDFLTPLVPMGFLLGRLANFVNGELWGNVSNVPWAVIFPRSAPGVSPELIAPRHPSQLYEAGTEGLILLLYMQWRFWKTDAQKYPGRMCAEFLLIYSVSRIFCEQFREPDASLIFGMSRGVFYTFFLLALAAWFMVQSYRKPPIVLPYKVAPDTAAPEKKTSKRR